MRNFLALLGWSPGQEEIVPEQEMIARFALEDIQKKAAVFDTTKLEWMNGQFLSMLPAEELLAPVTRQLALMAVPHAGRDLLAVIGAVKARSRTITHVAEQVAVRLDGSRVVRDEKGTALAAKMGDRFVGNLRLAIAALESIPWDSAAIEAGLKALAEREGLKLGDVMQPIRVALTGGTVSEPVPELLAVVGKRESLERLSATTTT
jgi:glutamyl-tRNA synthetase